jgi:hypothetical protein
MLVHDANHDEYWCVKHPVKLDRYDIRYKMKIPYTIHESASNYAII